MTLYPVAFVSLGPGEAELITLKGLKTLQSAEWIFCPYTCTTSGNKTSRAMDILTELGIGDTRLRLFEVPMNKDRSAAMEGYSAVSGEIAEYYKTGRRIAVAVEGDASFYSSIRHMGDVLAANDIPVETVAGVPAFIACGALANIHIVKQDERLYIAPGTVTLDELKKRLEKGDTVVVMKLSQCEDAIKQAITMLENVDFHYFENAGIAGKEFYSCDKEIISNRLFPYFSLMIIRS